MKALSHLLLAIVALVAGAVPLSAQDPGEKPRGPLLTETTGRIAERVYKKTATTELKIFVHFPPDWKTGDARPAIVFFFGGGWKAGSPTQFLSQAQYFASRGMVAARADYRVASRDHVTPESCVEDAKSAMRWVRGNAGKFGIDPDRIVAAGGSAGGHLAACTALIEGFDAADDKRVSCTPNALVLFNPVLDMLRIPPGYIKDQQVAQQISPNAFVKKGVPPAILFFGTADGFLEQGRDFLEKSKAAGNRAELYTAAGQPHGFFNSSPWTEITTRKADEFLLSIGYVNNEPTLKIPADEKTLKKEE